MIKFRVHIHGKHFLVRVIRKRWFRPDELLSKPAGFYTTRFVQAPNANEALDEVLKNLRDELDRDERTTGESIMELVSIGEDEDGFDQYAPGAGYTFYWEDPALPE